MKVIPKNYNVFKKDVHLPDQENWEKIMDKNP